MSTQAAQAGPAGPGPTPAEPDDAGAAGEGTTEPRATGPDRERRGAFLLPWLGVPVLVVVAYLCLPSASELRSHYQGSAVALIVAPALAWLLTRPNRLAHHTAGALAAAVLPGLTLISLHGTDWFFSGPFGDQSFRLEYAARFADDLGSLSDYTYRGVPAFYSPGWFWVVGLVARVTDLPAWHAYKWVAIGSLYVAGAITFALWRRTCGTRLSAVLTTVTIVGLPFAGSGWLGAETLMFSGGYEPYGWLVALPLPALLAWFAGRHGAVSWPRGIALGAALAAAAWLYLLYALVAVVAVLLVAVARRRERGRLLEVLAAGLTSIVLVSPWLGRFLIEWLAAGRPPAVATTWVEDDSYVDLVVPSPSPWVLVALIGAVGLLVVPGRAPDRLGGCRAVAAAVVLLGVVQLLAGQAGAGALFHRLLIVLGVALLAAGTCILAPLVAPAIAWLGRVRPAIPARRLLAAGLTVLLFLGLSGHAREWMDMGPDLRKLAHDVPYPDGSFPDLATAGTRESMAGQPSVDDLDAAVARVARSAGQDEPGVVLTDDISLLTTTPLAGYLQWWELYSNPLGEYEERRAYLERLAEADPADVPSLLRAEEDAPTVFVLRSDGSDLTFGSTAWDAGAARSSGWSVRFPETLFESDEFTSTQVGEWTVAALRTG